MDFASKGSGSVLGSRDRGFIDRFDLSGEPQDAKSIWDARVGGFFFLSNFFYFPAEETRAAFAVANTVSARSSGSARLGVLSGARFACAVCAGSGEGITCPGEACSRG